MNCGKCMITGYSTGEPASSCCKARRIASDNGPSRKLRVVLACGRSEVSGEEVIVTNSLLIAEAHCLATKVHASIGQVRKYTGEPYLWLPEAVADIVRTVPQPRR